MRGNPPPTAAKIAEEIPQKSESHQPITAVRIGDEAVVLEGAARALEHLAEALEVLAAEVEDAILTISATGNPDICILKRRTIPRMTRLLSHKSFE